MTAEALARAFHAEAVEHNALGKQHPPVVIPPWEEIAEEERARRVASCQLALDRL